MTDKVAAAKAEMKARREKDSRYSVGPSGIPRYARWVRRNQPKHPKGGTE
jgi:hypothetical protein